ncbi:MAG: hypothetical protein ACRDWI_09275 [Jiangellaceae bacterium]
MTAPDGNLLVLSLPDRESGQEPGIEWLSLRAERGRDEFADDPIAPQAPVSEWTLDDVVKVLDDGRSLHWEALPRVARHGDDGLGCLLRR